MTQNNANAFYLTRIVSLQYIVKHKIPVWTNVSIEICRKDDS